MSRKTFPHLLERVQRQLRLAAQARAIRPGVAVPYFAHMRIHADGKVRDVLLGNTTCLGTVSIVDWQTAPLAEAFFSAAEGEDYEIDTGDRVLEGTLIERNLAGFIQGELAQLTTPEGQLDKDGDTWCMADDPPVVIPPRPNHERRQASSPTKVVLDAAQRKVVDLPAGRSVLLLGEAGFGKTTVALHRLAHLKRENPTAHAAVIVPTLGLRQLTRALLQRLELEHIDVWLFEDWARTEARRVFANLPMRESQDASAAVVRLKRDPALRVALAELAPHPPTLGKTRRRTTRRDLLHLFGDRTLMEKVVAVSNQRIGQGAVADVLEHTHVQWSRIAEKEYAHVDVDRLQTLDGRSLDDGTPMEDAGTLDTEDYAVLFELQRLRAASRSEKPLGPRLHDILVIDEAQEFAPLELALLGQALAPHGTLIAAGDAGQQVDPAACFHGWEATMAELGCCSFEKTVLAVSYRCPDEVTALARWILDPSLPRPPARRGIVRAQHPTLCHQADWLIRELRQLHIMDPSASVAIICRSPEAARRLAPILHRGVGVRLALDGDYQFTGGIHLTCVQQVKGLEFDYVIVPDAQANVYPDTPASRRALYVAVTRASHQLVLSACTQDPLQIA